RRPGSEVRSVRLPRAAGPGVSGPPLFLFPWRGGARVPQDTTPTKTFPPAGWALRARRAPLAPGPLPLPAQATASPAAPRGVHGFLHHTGDGDPYVLFLAGKDTVMSGSTSDIDKARKLRKSDNEEMLWFEHGGKEYVIRDAAILQQIKALFE